MGVSKMEQKEMFKQMIEFNKKAFDNTFNAMVMFQDQTERMVMTMLDQATWMPEEGKKALTEWTNAYKMGRENFQKAVEESFRKVEDFFSGGGK
ncbi:MAG: hypothetical protein AB1896_16710 [Thermodesulfobacteriota bacterium]